MTTCTLIEINTLRVPIIFPDGWQQHTMYTTTYNVCAPARFRLFLRPLFSIINTVMVDFPYA